MDLDRLPHRPPFRFLTRIESVEPGVRADGWWLVSGDEDFFRGHFPGNAIVPGVLIAEALAQLSGLIVAAGERAIGRLGHVDIKFTAVAVPPAEIRLRSSIRRALADLAIYDVAADVAGEVVAQGSLILHKAPS